MGNVLTLGHYSGLAAFSDGSVGTESSRDGETRGHNNRYSRGTSHCGRRFGKL